MANSNALPSRDDRLRLSTSIKVLVVESKNDFHAYLAELGQSLSFEVTRVDHSAAALQVLSLYNTKFDLLLVDNDINDGDIHTFLRLTRNMDLLSVVMCDQENDSLIVEAFKSGAFLVLQRPLTLEALWLMSQDVIRERLHKNAKHKNRIPMSLTRLVTIKEEESYGRNKRDYRDVTKEVTQTIVGNNLHVQSSEYCNDDGMKKRMCVDWTPELHEKFLNAVNYLGEGRCFPKEILMHMGVPGLTRMQVASHLQKHRNDTSKLLSHGAKESELGYMSSLKTLQTERENGPNVDINTSVNGWQTGVNNMNNQNRQSSMMNGPLQENIPEPAPYRPVLIKMV